MPVKDRSTQSESMLFLQRKQKEREPDDTSESTQNARSERHRRSGRGSKCFGESEKMFREASLTNESKIAPIEVQVWNDGRVNLHNILHSDYLYGLHNY